MHYVCVSIPKPKFISIPIQICFAYKGNFAGLVVRVSFIESDEESIIRSSGFRNLQIR